MKSSYCWDSPGSAETLLIRLLPELPAELCALFGRHSRKRHQGRTLIVLFQKSSNDLALAVQSLFVGDVIVGYRALIVAFYEVSALILAITEGIHVIPSLHSPGPIL